MNGDHESAHHQFCSTEDYICGFLTSATLPTMHVENENRMASIANMKHVYGCFYLSFQTPTQLAASLENLDNVKVLNVTTPEGSEMQALLSPTTLEDIYGFYCLIKRTRLANETASIILYAGPIPRMQAACAYLLGCYMMLSDGLSVEDTRQHFEPLNCKAIATFESRDGLTLEDFWGAIHRARLPYGTH